MYGGMADEHDYVDDCDNGGPIPSTISGARSPVALEHDPTPKKGVEASRRYRKNMKRQKLQLTAKNEELTAKVASLERELEQLKVKDAECEALKSEIDKLRTDKEESDKLFKSLMTTMKKERTLTGVGTKERMEVGSTAKEHMDVGAVAPPADASCKPETATEVDPLGVLTDSDDIPDLELNDIEENIKRIEGGDDLIIEWLDSRDQVDTLTQQNQSLQQNMKKMAEEIQKLSVDLGMEKSNCDKLIKKVQFLEDENTKLKQSKTAIQENFRALLQQMRLTARQLEILAPRVETEMESSCLADKTDQTQSLGDMSSVIASSDEKSY